MSASPERAARPRLLPALLLLALAACQLPSRSSRPSKGASDPLDAAESTPTVRELQASVLAYGDVFSATVSATADDIAASVSSREIRETTLRWKLRVIPSMRDATSEPDPRRAVLDAWVMTVRLRTFLAEGEGATYFGSEQHVAIAAMDELTKRIENVVREILTPEEMASAVEDVNALAAGRPMTGRFAADLLRASNDVSEDLHPAASGLLSIQLSGVAEGAEAIDRVAHVLAVTTEVIEALPEETRWQSELLMLEIGKLEEDDPAVQSLVRLSESSARLPADLRRELEAALAASEGPLVQAKGIAEELRAAVDAAGPVATTLDEMTAKLAEAAVTWEAAAKEVHEIVALLSAPDDGSDSGDDFSLEELTAAGDAVHAGSAELRALLTDVQSSDLRESAEEQVHDLLNQLTIRAAALAALVLVGLFLVRRSTRRSG